jgi:dihydroflavonol-4-reductase
MVFVTGATGLVGSHLLLELIRQNMKVRAGLRDGSSVDFVRSLFDYHGLGGRFVEIEWVDFDLQNPIACAESVKACEFVFHCAALVSFFSNDEQALYDINVQGTRNLVNACLQQGVEKLCHVSSTGAIGRQLNKETVDENDRWSEKVGNSVYSKTKHLAELEVWRAVEEGLKAVVVNPCIVMGPAKDARSSAAILANAKKGRRFYSPGSNAFVDARDLASCMLNLTLGDAVGERFLVVGENQSYRKVFEILAAKFGVKGPDRSLPRWMAELAWRLEMIRSFFAGSTPLLARETVDSAYHQVRYSNEKIKRVTGHEFRNLREMADYAVPAMEALVD